MRRFSLFVRVACAAVALAGPAQAAFAGGHLVYKFTLPPGGSKTIALPVVQAPVRLAASLSFETNGVVNSSELVSAVVNQDPAGQVTWVATNADGSRAAGSTPGATRVASFRSGGTAVTAAAGDGRTRGSLAFSQGASERGVPGTYWVVLTY